MLIKRRFKCAVSLLLCFALMLTTFAGVSLSATAAEADKYDRLRQKFYTMAVGGPYDPNDSALTAILKDINDTAQAYWDRMNKNPVSTAQNGWYCDSSGKLYAGVDPSRDYIFEEYPLGRRTNTSVDSNSIHFTFQYLRAMALAYETPGCDLYQNKNMLADIKTAVEHVYANHFNSAVGEYGNWFAWDIGAPIYLGETLMLLYDEFTSAEIAKYAASIVNWVKRDTHAGANGSWVERVRMYGGILLKDDTWLDFVSGRLPSLLLYTTSGDGYYADGTFVQHNDITYNGGYGLMCLTDMAYLTYMLSDTEWQVSKDRASIMYDWIYDSYIPVVYEGLTMDAFRGREITRTDTTQPKGTLIIANAMLMLAETASEKVALDFKGYIKDWFSNDFIIDELNSGTDTPWYKFPMDTAVKIQRILADESIEALNLKGTNIQMASGARTIHNAQDFTYVVSMTNRRISGNEQGDSNIKGWYTGNGMTHLYNNDITRYEGVNKPTIDWYRLPGTTAVYGKSQNWNPRNQNSFTGGTTDGVYGVSGMDMSISSNNLKAKKSWFMFDDEVVALGSNISGTGQVETTFENYMLWKNNRSYFVDGKEIAMTMNGTEIPYNNISTLNIKGNVADSDIGFYFPNKASVRAKSETRTGKWTDLGTYNTDTSVQSADWFTVWQSHGTNASNGSYAYVLLPGKNAEETEAYAVSSDIEIIRQDDVAHAVYEKSLGLVGINFWNKDGGALSAFGTETFLRCDSAATLLIKEDETGMEISIADSTQEDDSITLMINRGASSVVEADAGITVKQASPYIHLTVNTKNSAGKTYKVRFAYEGEVELTKTEITSAEMIDDALVVSMTGVAGAKAYEVVVKEGDKVVKTLQSSKTQLSIYGLTPGKTYTLTAQAVAGEEKGPISDAVTTDIPETTKFIDELADFSKMYSFSDGWIGDPADNDGVFGGDITRLKRSAQTVESFAYYLPGLLDFSIPVYGYHNSIGVINIYTSEDGVTWTKQEHTAEGAEPANDQWFSKTLVPKDGEVNENANYLKIELVSHPDRVWAPQFTKVEAELVNTCDQKVLLDTMQNDVKTYFAENAVYSAVDLTGYGDATLVGAGAKDAELIYSWTNIQSFSAVYYVKGGEVTFATSTDGEKYSEVTANTIESEANADGYKKIEISASNFADNTDYLNITISGDAYVGDLSLTYKPDNAPAKQIRFAEKRLDSVIGYDVTPLVKVAPMNSTSEFTYRTDNSAVATYIDGVLDSIAQGETIIRVSADDSTAVASMPIKVYRNIALNRSTSASTTSNLYPLSQGVDGNIDVTRWQSETELAEWYQVDLGANAKFDAIDITWFSNGAEYQILASNDAAEWTELASVTDAKSGAYVRFDFDTTQEFRYIKMQGVSENQYSLFEIRALQAVGDAAIIESENIALGKNAEVSAVDTGTAYVAANAVDGDEGTRWASARNDNQWFIVDLEESSTIQGFEILWEGAYGKEYKIQISDNKSTWTDVVSETNGSVGWKYYTLDNPVKGRYVRMLGIKRGTNYGYSIFEFRVMGTPNVEAKDVYSISLDKAEVSLIPSWTEQLTATTFPTNINKYSLKWESSDTNVAIVSDNGLITGVGVGTATITVSAVKNPKVKASCTVNVSPYASQGRAALPALFACAVVADPTPIAEVTEVPAAIAEVTLGDVTAEIKKNEDGNIVKVDPNVKSTKTVVPAGGDTKYTTVIILCVVAVVAVAAIVVCLVLPVVNKKKKETEETQAKEDTDKD